MSTPAETPTGAVADGAAESRAWWEAHRAGYNVALLISGAAAFLAYCGAVEICVRRNADVDVEITLFSIVGMGMVYAFAMALANVFYGLGGLAERRVRPRHPDRFRPRLYLLGLVFSMALPWVLPVAVAIECMTAPTCMEGCRHVGGD